MLKNGGRIHIYTRKWTLISDNGSYDENIMYYVEDENGKFHDIFDYLNILIKTP